MERLSFAYPESDRPALADVSLEIRPGELTVVLGTSGSGKSTLLRALAGLVPHFHGGRFSGRVVVAGHDTRSVRPAELAGTVATLFQDPEDQVVFTRVENEIAFGLENVATPPAEIAARTGDALAAVSAEHLAGRKVAELSGGELQRVCLAATLALEPQLLLLDEPTSQLDADAAEDLLELTRRLAAERGTAVLIAEQRPERPLDLCDRLLFLDGGRVVLDVPRGDVPPWVADYAALPAETGTREPRDSVCTLESVSFAYPRSPLVLDGQRLELRRGEIVALTGPNGSGKTTLAKLAAGLLEPQAGRVVRSGRACYLSQDPGRYLVCERAREEVALAVGGDGDRARRALELVGLAGLGERHPRDLSSGERERLGLAAVLVAEPDLLVLDEPTRGVDPPRKRELAALLRAGAAERATLVVTHDRRFAEAVADRHVSPATEPEVVVA